MVVSKYRAHPPAGFRILSCGAFNIVFEVVASLLGIAMFAYAEGMLHAVVFREPRRGAF